MSGAAAMTLRQLLGRDDAPDVAVTAVSDDSRRTVAGSLFIACAGTVHDGHDFAADAVRRGAVAVLSERPLDVGVPNLTLDGLAGRRGQLAARFHGWPGRELDVVGVTGTNGKTTVAHGVAGVLPDAAFLGTVGWGVPGRLRPSSLTTEDAITVQSHLRELARQGARRVAMEVSSHALDQGRVDEVAFDVGVFTNLSRDHLDYHGTMARYAEAKKRLFRTTLKAAVINVDDQVGRDINALVQAAGIDAVGFGTGPNARVTWSDATFGQAGLAGRWHTPWGSAPFEVPGAYGAFSLYNCAAVVATACVLGTPLDEVVHGLGRLPPPPGRMQTVAPGARPVTIVDYAHTPDGLKAALGAIRRHLPQGAPARVLVVFGCGGNRDRGKRAAMAREAEAGADAVFVTSDNPRHEDPERILDDTMAGFDNPAPVRRIADRAAALEAAILSAGDEDVVLLAGKGHEDYQEIAGQRLPFSDIELARSVLARRAHKAGGGEGERCCLH